MAEMHNYSPIIGVRVLGGSLDPSPPSGDPVEVVVTAIGEPSDEPWDMAAAGASVISILKRIALNTDTA